MAVVLQECIILDTIEVATPGDSEDKIGSCCYSRVSCPLDSRVLSADQLNAKNSSQVSQAITAYIMSAHARVIYLSVYLSISLSLHSCITTGLQGTINDLENENDRLKQQAEDVLQVCTVALLSLCLTNSLNAYSLSAYHS